MSASTRCLVRSRCPWVWTPVVALVLAAGMIRVAGDGVTVPESGTEGGPLYRRDIRQLLSKAGCNAGPCHGNANGKGGFKLSLRGEDPGTDWMALVVDQGGRRVQPLNPDGSLLLLKATAQLAHEGGQRFGLDSWEYVRLRDWIARGATDDGEPPSPVASLDVDPAEVVLSTPVNPPVPLRVIARYADGTQRDVTAEAVYETLPPTLEVDAAGVIRSGPLGEGSVLVRYLEAQVPVRVALIPGRPDFAWTTPASDHPVDRAVDDLLRSRQLHPSEVCTDDRYLRRIALDLLGRLPTREELAEFREDSLPDKRRQWADRFLLRPEFADAWALKWADLLRVEERTLDAKGMDLFHRWIRQAIDSGMPMDQFSRAIVAAQGSTYVEPPANFYRANRTPVDRGLAVAQVFLGVRLHCAQCHNHPFDRWSQDDYHDWAAIFGKVQYRVLRNDRRDSNDSHEFKGEQVVFWDNDAAPVRNPRTGQPAVARYLGETEPSAPDASPTDLAGWLVRQPAFATMHVNRVWSHLMGRGLVDPVDDLRATNPPTHPALLDELTRCFVESGYDLRSLIRQIVTSRTYQQESRPHPDNHPDEQLYSWVMPRRLPAEMLLDAVHQVAGVVPGLPGYPEGLRAVQLPGGLSQKRGKKSDAETFLELFGKPPRLLTCDCERTSGTSMAQAFHLINSPLIHGLLENPANRLRDWVDALEDPTEAIRVLFEVALSRPPDSKELSELSRHVQESAHRRTALEDILWGLVNSAEFIHRF